MANVLVVDAHPDAAPERFVHALADAYAEGARGGGHDVDVVRLAGMDVPRLVTREEWERDAPPEAIRAVQERLRAADTIVVVFPLWLGDMPALLKAFLEQALRPGFAFAYVEGGALPRKLLGGKSARIVVTMGMPALVYRWFFGAHSVKSLKRNILQFVGIKPVRTTLIGNVEGSGPVGRRKWLDEMRRLGRSAS